MVYLSGFNLLTLVNNSWRTWATPTQYAVFMILAYELSYNKTQDTSYSMVLSVHMASAAGYLYEIPRYLTLQGFRGLLRVNKFSVFHIDYAILAVFVVMWLLWRKGVKTNRLLLCGYCLYTVWYFFNFNDVQSVKYIYAWFYDIRVPWVCLFRSPTMLFLLSLTQTLNKQLYNTVIVYNDKWRNPQKASTSSRHNLDQAK